MAAKKAVVAFDPVEAMIGAFATNQRINEYLLDHLPDEAWRAKPAKGRDVGAMAAHIHNVRLIWLKAAGAAVVPAKLDADVCTKAEARAALVESYQALNDLVSQALRGDGRIKGFKPDVASFLAYLFAHDAHHRGQISMLARQVGHPLPQSAMFGMWEWGTR